MVFMCGNSFLSFCDKIAEKIFFRENYTSMYIRLENVLRFFQSEARAQRFITLQLSSKIFPL